LRRLRQVARSGGVQDHPPLEYAWRTHTGLLRDRNEDAVAVLPEQGIMVVADGIGGASAGEVASSMATEIISKRLGGQVGLRTNRKRALMTAEAAVSEANAAIFARARSEARCAGMGTTVVVGCVGDGWMAYAHVGDSRLYQLRENALHQLTVDHSFIRDVVNKGFFPSVQEARAYGINENILTRAVGSAPQLAISVNFTDLQPGDLYLMCTDGLSNMVSDDALRSRLSTVEDTLDAAANALIRLACEAGGVDNITLALMRVNRVETG
jgi:protein phosphatase